VLNGDMIGRNNPDTAALLGSQPPHRNSAELVQMALDANRAVSRFVVDSSWDRPTHPEGWYFRSDHVPYAEQEGIWSRGGMRGMQPVLDEYWRPYLRGTGTIDEALANVIAHLQ